MTAANDEQTAPPAPASDPDVLTVEEAAAFLRMGRNSVYEAVGRGEIPHRRIGRTIRFSRAALARWLDAPPAAPKRARSR